MRRENVFGSIILHILNTQGRGFAYKKHFGVIYCCLLGLGKMNAWWFNISKKCQKSQIHSEIQGEIVKCQDISLVKIT